MSEKAKPLTAEEEAELRQLTSSWPPEYDVPRLFAMLDAARERIAELEARVRDLEQEDDCHAAEEDGWEHDFAQERARAEAAEARERKLVEALREARDMLRSVHCETDDAIYLAAWRNGLHTIDAALSPYTPASVEMPGDVHPQGE